MDIKSYSEGPNKTVKLLVNLVLTLVGVGLMMFAIISPLVTDFLALVVFFIGMGISEKPLEKLTSG